MEPQDNCCSPNEKRDSKTKQKGPLKSKQSLKRKNVEIYERAAGYSKQAIFDQI